jgi:glucose/arabinose dehydrogenase
VPRRTIGRSPVLSQGSSRKSIVQAMAHTRTHTKLTVLAALVFLLIGAVAAGSLDAKPKKKKKKAAALERLFDSRPVAGPFDKPIAFDYLPNGKMVVGEKAGKIYLVDGTGVPKLLLDISGRVVDERERGLEGVEVASDFAATRRIYLVYTYKVNPLNEAGPQALRLTYITLNPDDTVANPASPETVLLGKDATGPCPAVSNKRDCPPSISAVHQGGTVLSAPDGTLFVGYGDSNLPDSPGNQVFRAYNPASTAGKLLHIDAEGNGLPDHPFCRKTKKLDRTCTKIFAVGFRNPFRFVLTPSGKPLLADVGWNLREEINLVKKGDNYGWPCMEGSIRTPFYREKGRCKNLYRNMRKLSGPIHEYPNNAKLGGAAAIMGPQHQSQTYPPGLKGAYFFGDYASRFIKEGVLRKGKLKGIRTVATDVFPVQFRNAPNGNVAYVDFVIGTVNELVYAPNKAPSAVASASPQAFCNASDTVTFSAAGSTDPEGDPLTFTWEFGDGSPNQTGSGVTHNYPVVPDPAVYTATLRVSDGISTSTATVKVFAGNCPPAVSILSPTGATTWRGGAAVGLTATGSDPEGPLSFSWDVGLVHKDHRHELGVFAGSSTQFIPATDHDADSHYEVTLSVTDSGGYTLKLPTIDVNPETARLRLRTNIGKVKLSYGGRTVKAPEKLRGAIGFRANLSAPREVKKKGKTFRFKRWSQGGGRAQVYDIPPERSTVRAIYKPRN